MRATAEHSTVLIPRFPVALRLQVKALANLQGRKMHEVFADLITRALATSELASVIRSKKGGEKS